MTKFTLLQFIAYFSKGFRKRLLFIYIFILISMGISYTSPLLIKYVIDDIIPIQNISLLHTAFIVLILITITTNCMEFFKNKTHLFVGEMIVKNIKFQLLNKLQKTTLSKLTQYHSGYVYNRIINEIDTVDEFITMFLFNIILNSFSLIIGFGALYYFSPLLLIIIALCIPFFFIPYWIFGKSIASKQNELWNENAKMEAFLLDYIKIISHNRNIFISSSQYFQDKVVEIYNNVLNKYLPFQNLQYVVNFLQNICQSLLPQLIFWLGFYLVMKEDLTLGTIIALQFYLNFFIKPIAFFVNNSFQIKIFKKKIRRIEEILNWPEYNERQTSSLINIQQINVKELSFSYDKTPIFEHFNFILNQGDFIGLQGKSGIGKSTFAKVLSGLLEPTFGEILWNNQSTQSINIQKKIYYCPQHTLVFEGDAYENIAIKPKQKLSSLELDFIHEWQTKLNLNFNLNRNIKENAENLSGGEKQKLGILRALVSKKKYLIFDESFSQIDQKDRIIIVKLLHRHCIKNNITAILISQVSDIFTMNNIKIIEFKDLCYTN